MSGAFSSESREQLRREGRSAEHGGPGTQTVKDAGGVAGALLPDSWVLLFLPGSRHCISQSDVFGWEPCDYMGECGALRGSIPLRHLTPCHSPRYHPPLSVSQAAKMQRHEMQAPGSLMT